MSDDERRLRMYVRLHLAEGVGAIIFGRLIDAFGSIGDVWSASASQWRKVDGVGPKLAEAMSVVTEADVDRELSDAADIGVTVLCSEDDAYPVALKTIFDYPRVLYVRGALEAADAVAMAVVGSRHCTHYGLEQAERFGQLLGRAGFTVVSGGARGVDSGAHRGALAVGGRTVAVMGCGLGGKKGQGKVYPPENADLFAEIVSQGRGALVSELPMRTAVLGANFPRRNRIISGLSLGVVVIEAARRSGSLVTARIANEQGRAVFAVPGRVDSPMSLGTNELIRDGVTLVQNLDDVLEHLGQLGEEMTGDDEKDEKEEKLSAGEMPIPDGLDGTESALLAAMAAGEANTDELVRRTGLAAGRVVSALTMLTLRGLVRQRPGNVFVRRKAAAGSR